MELFAFGRFIEHEKRGCVGNASHALFRFGACALEFVEDTIA